jgi:hypothetical protein
VIGVEGVAMSEVVLRMRRCRACGAIFSVCSHCDRGQCYCSQDCRRGARRQQLRAANRRYQRTDGGRRAHRTRQRSYRFRRLDASVTDHGSLLIVAPHFVNRKSLGNCAVCGRYSRWIDPFPAIPLPRSPQRRHRAVGKGSKIYVFR